MGVWKPMSLPVCGAALALSASALPPERGPAVIEPDVERTYVPLWVSAEAAIDLETVLDWDLVGPVGNESLRQTIERQRQKLEKKGMLEEPAPGEWSVRSIPATECEEATSSIDCDYVGIELPRRNLRDLVRHSRSIFKGVIRGVEPGFSSGTPYSLLIVQVTDLVRGSEKLKQGRVFVDYPVARFAIGPYHFCNAEKGFEPRLGDQLLLFDYGGTWVQLRFFVPGKEQVFFENTRGDLLLPDQLRGDKKLAGVKSLDEVIARIREIELSELGATDPEGASEP